MGKIIGLIPQPQAKPQTKEQEKKPAPKPKTVKKPATAK